MWISLLTGSRTLILPHPTRLSCLQWAHLTPLPESIALLRMWQPTATSKELLKALNNVRVESKWYSLNKSKKATRPCRRISIIFTPTKTFGTREVTLLRRFSCVTAPPHLQSFTELACHKTFPDSYIFPSKAALFWVWRGTVAGGGSPCVLSCKGGFYDYA